MVRNKTREQRRRRRLVWYRLALVVMFLAVLALASATIRYAQRIQAYVDASSPTWGTAQAIGQPEDLDEVAFGQAMERYDWERDPVLCRMLAGGNSVQ